MHEKIGNDIVGETSGEIFWLISEGICMKLPESLSGESFEERNVRFSEEIDRGFF